MKDFSANHYESAFENWLIDNHIRYLPVNSYKRKAFSRSKIKSFDFLVCPNNTQTIIAEVKGRKFNGTSLAKLAGFQCWVPTDDIDGLCQWQKILGPAYAAAFIFVYRIEKVNVNFDGRRIFDFDDSRYIFFYISLEDYQLYMKRRSPKWSTITLPADKFRKCAVQRDELWP